MRKAKADAVPIALWELSRPPDELVVADVYRCSTEAAMWLTPSRCAKSHGSPSFARPDPALTAQPKQKLVASGSILTTNPHVFAAAIRKLHPPSFVRAIGTGVANPLRLFGPPQKP